MFIRPAMFFAPDGDGGAAEPASVGDTFAAGREALGEVFNTDLGDDAADEIDDSEGEEIDDGGEGEGDPAPEGDAGGEPKGSEPTVEDPFAPYGGKQNVEDLVALGAALRTEQGLKQIGARSLIALGMDPAQVEAFLAGKLTAAEATTPAPAAASDELEIDDEDVVTGAQAKALIENAVKEALAKAVDPIREAEEKRQQRETEERQSRATHTVDTTLIDLLGDKEAEDPASTVDPEMANLVLLEAQRHLGPDEWDPAKIAAAVRQGHADLVAKFERAQEKYLGGKRETKQRLPKKTGGSPAGSNGKVEEPKNVEEAIAAGRPLLKKMFGG